MHFYIDRMVQNEFGKRKKKCVMRKNICAKFVRIYSQKDVYCLGNGSYMMLFLYSVGNELTHIPSRSKADILFVFIVFYAPAM